MQKEHQIIPQVLAAKKDMKKADDLIRAYVPFIRSEVSKFIGRLCTEQEDEFSIAMIAFHEAIRGFAKERGAFLAYASMLIKSRLIDHERKEARHKGQISIYQETGKDDQQIQDTLMDTKDHYQETVNLAAARSEIAELGKVMAEFGVTFTDISENSPKQQRTLMVCGEVIRYAGANPHLLEELLRTKKLPLAELVKGTGAERKTLERHRKYILAMLLIQTNGYEMIRGHLRHVLKGNGGATQ